MRDCYRWLLVCVCHLCALGPVSLAQTSRPEGSEFLAERVTDWLGLPAPAVSGQDFEGQGISLAELKGRVVLLDFWSVQCIPCLAGLPELQEVEDHFSGRPVTVLGINTNSANKLLAAREALAARKIRMRQWADSRQRCCDRFAVEGLPTRILLDKNGIVQAVHVGAMEQERETLIGEIEQLLEGKPLVDDAELSKLRARQEARRRADPAAAISKPAWALADLEPGRVDFHRRFDDLMVEGMYVTRGIVDESGEIGLILPQTGSLTVYRPSTGRLERIRLSMPGSRSTYVWVQSLMTQAGPRWGTAARVFELTDAGEMTDSRIVFGLHTTSGELCWQRIHALPAGVGHAFFKMSSADLDGDGQEELVILATLHASEKWPANHLIVYNAEGELLALRFVGRQLFHFFALRATSGSPGQIVLVHSEDRTTLLVYQFAADGTEQGPGL